MQNQIKPPALNDNMSREELAKRVEEMTATDSDTNPVDETFLDGYENRTFSHVG